jgi:ribosomal protein S18 acetylase RimI-like enzyme
MPQASLLDFFQSRSGGPFAPAALPVEPSRPEAESALDAHDVQREQESREGPTLSLESLRKDLNGTAPTSSPGDAPSHGEATDDLNESAQLLRVPALTIVAVKNDHISALKRLTGNLLPVRYPDKFFDGAVSEPIPATFSRVALIDGRPVGWIRCRLDPFPEPTVPPSDTKPIYNRIYVQALCLLAPHRGLGIATALLDTVTAPPLPHDYNIAHVYAHVWESNEEGLEWYDRRGFKRVMKVDQYYRKLRPNGAWIVRKDLDGA